MSGPKTTLVLSAVLLSAAVLFAIAAASAKAAEPAPAAASGAAPAGAAPAGAAPAGAKAGGDEKKAPATTLSAPTLSKPTAPMYTGKPEVASRWLGLKHYLAVSAIVFGLGITIIVVRRNAIAVLMGIELLLNSAGLNFVAFSKYVGKDIIDGQLVTIFVIVIAAAEAAVALAIILNIFNNLNTVAVDEADVLKG